MSPVQKKPLFSLFGASRVGTSLAYHLTCLSWRPALLWNRSPERLAITHQYVPFQQCTTDLAVFDGRSDWLILAVRDDALATVTQKLSELPIDYHKKKIFHVSGFWDSEILKPLQQRGAATGSMHPVLSIPDIEQGIKVLKGGVFTCEGQIKKDLEQVAQQLEGRAFLLTREQKKVVHVAAVFLNNYTLALIHALKKVAEQYGLEATDFEQIMLPTMRQVLETGWQADVPSRITGPIARGDVETISAHLSLLAEYPPLRELYQAYLALVRQILPASTPAINRSNNQHSEGVQDAKK